jgi:hypothetical protein
MLKEPAADLGRRIECATIVTRRSGKEYRLVLSFKTSHGTAVPEALPDCFSTPAKARLYAIRDLGLRPDHVRTAA